MSAVISGNGLGLFNTSLGQTGLGLGGNARLGAQGQDSQYVNVANGNLVLHSQDEQLLFRGMSLGQYRTYNSQAAASQVGGDGWLTGFERRVELLSGVLNTAGSVMRLHTGDGAFQDFTYVAPNTYRSTAGDGAHDTLSWTSASKTWTYVEGSTRREEAYADHANATLKGRLTRIRDLKSDGTNTTTWDVLYDGQGRITQLRTKDTTAGGTPDAFVFGYDANGRLSTLSTRENGLVVGQVGYGYDSAGRLSSVLVDLKPQDAGGDRETWDATTAENNDGYLFRTVYTYADATSLRITQVRQSDGTLVSYGYDAQGRVTSLTRGDTNADDTDGVGQTLTFTYDTQNRRTDVSDSAGRTWTYVHDAAGQLIEVHAPAVDGLRDITHYAYDGDGNLTQVRSERGGATLSRSDFQYDASGNLLWQWDVVDPDHAQAANAIQRTYTATNQLASETVYTGLDADGAASGNAPSGGNTTRYVYDDQNRLRFQVNAAGEVIEMIYAASGPGVGQVESVRRYLGDTFVGIADATTLAAWATTARRALSGLTTYTYDLRGRLAGTREYDTVDANGSGVVTDSTRILDYVYDAQGLLRQQIATRNAGGRAASGGDVREVTAYAYDGMGRLLSEIVEERWTPQGMSAQTRTVQHTSWSYLDSGGAIRSIVEGGTAGDGGFNDLLRVEVRDAAGMLVSVVESALDGISLTRQTHHFYDGTGRLRASEDANGARIYFFYDDEGALAAQVDETGAVVEYVRDAAGRVVSTIAYATRVTTAAWLVNGHVVKDDLDVVRPSTNAEDRTVATTFDALGRKASEVDAEGGITYYQYDGASRLVRTRITDSLGTAATERTTRWFHDSAGRLTGTLDAEGFLTEYAYDAGGRLMRTHAYATATSAGLRASGSLEDLRPTTSQDDALTRMFYDGRNNLIGQLDAEGYFTEFVFDEARNERASIAYALQLDSAAPNATFSTLRTAARAGSQLETRRGYDAMGRLLVERNPSGTVTRFTYDLQGRLVHTQSAADSSEVRENNRRYDVFGNLIAELGGEGSTYILPGMNESELDGVYFEHGTRHTYDALGQRTESVDALGNRTWYFYDGAGRLTHTVYGVEDDDWGIPNAAGEVEEIRYDTFGQVRETIAYTGRIAIAPPFGREEAAAAVQILQYVAGIDSQQQLRYDRRGLLVERTDGEGFRASFQYDAFGALIREEAQRTASDSRVTTHAYDRRGQLLQSIDDATGIAQTRSAQYDAFGRVLVSMDERGIATTYTYDRMGRQVGSERTASGVSQTTTTQYDAYSRVVSRTDALGRTTTFVHDDIAMTMTMTTPEGLHVITTYNEHGQTVAVENANGYRNVFEYDHDGRLTYETEENAAGDDYGYSANTGISYDYDARGQLISRSDDGGVSTEYVYDARGRVIAKYEGDFDPTTYLYDGQGRQVRVTDPTGVVTAMRYDLDGRLIESVVDPDGFALRTTYTWDGVGQQLTVTQGAGTDEARTVAYTYDGLGRRASETVAPGSLNLTTTYVYDISGNVVASIDPEQHVSRFVYDEANRLILSVDADGGVAEILYDAAGQVLSRRQYATRVALSGLGNVVSEADVRARIVRDDSHDLQAYFIYDADGRQTHGIDGAGAVTRQWYNAAGKVTQVYRYATAVDLGSLRNGLESGAYSTGEMEQLVHMDAARDVVNSYFYDVGGRLRFTVDGQDAVVEYRYDGGGRLTEKVSHTYQPDMADAHSGAREGSMDAAYVQVRMYQNDDSRYQSYIYDSAGRLEITLTYVTQAGWSDSLGYWSRGELQVHRDVHDGAGRLIQSIDYGSAILGREQSFARGIGYFPDLYSVRDVVGELEYQAGMPIEYLPQRTTNFVYDDAGRQRFVISPLGAVEETVFDAAGNVREVRAYKDPVSAGGNMPEWYLDMVLANQTDVRVTRQYYDDAGRMTSRTDALQNTEGFAYDGNGLLTSYTDKNQATWTYEYDSAGRRIAETSPQVVVTTAAPDGSVSSTVRSIVTRTEYDALGNVTRRIEDAGGQARATRYEYDSRGLQVRTVFPDAGRLGSGNQIEATNQEATIDVAYDMLGRAVMQKDVRGNYSFKAYGVRDELLFEVDQEGYVTSYEYNLFGDQERLTRHANRIDVTPGLPMSEAAIASRIIGNPSQDRIIDSYYDVAGRKTQVVEPVYRERWGGAPGWIYGLTKEFVYDLYGDVVAERTLREYAYSDPWYDRHWFLHSSYMTWDETLYQYDKAGNRTYEINADGYVTEWYYSARGELEAQVEYARTASYQTDMYGNGILHPIPDVGDESTGFDRITSWEYDALGRRVHEYSMRGNYDDAHDVQTDTYYDAGGRATSVVVNGQETRTAYDALGRVTSVRESERRVVKSDSDGLLGDGARNLRSDDLYRQVSPYSTMAYDAFGNVVQLRRYANGIEGQQAAVESAGDTVHTTRYDWQGRAVWERDATGTVHTKVYDAADNLLSTRYDLDGSSGRWATVINEATYDKAGRQLTSGVRRELHQGSSQAVVDSVVDATWQVRYNAFGEIVAKDTRLSSGLATENFAAQYQYDTNGRLVATNAEGGVWKHYRYDARGGLVSEQHDVRDSQGNVITVETRMDLDARGNVLIQYLPSNDDSPNGTVTIEKSYDRWGNVLSLTDQKGNTTSYRYNQLDQMLEQLGAQVLVVHADGSKEVMRPLSKWEYDDLGRLLATIDANGNRRENRYDTAGRLIYSEDALDNRTDFAYDALGQKRYTQDPIGYVTYLDYDAAGRVVAQGDYLRNEDRTERTRYAREQYVLNQNGDRLSVKDALGYTSTYEYDSRGLVIRSRTAAGVAMEYAYDGNGNKTRETNALSLPSLATDGSPVYQGGLIQNHIAVEGQPFQYTIPADTFVIGGGETPELIPSVSVWDEALKTYREIKPIGFDAQTRTLSFTPAQAGEYVITITARSSAGGTSMATSGMSVITQNSYDQYFAYVPRAMGGLRDQVVVPGQSFSYQIPAGTVVDPQGGPITYAAYINSQVTRWDESDRAYITEFESITLGLTPGEHWLTFDPATGTLSGVAPNVDSVEVQIVATDSEGKSMAMSLRVNASYAHGRQTVVDEGETLNLDEQTWDYDYFGRLIDHNDLSGADYDYEYDAVTGQLIGQDSDWTVAARRYETPVTDRWYARDWTQQGLDGLVGLELPDPVLVNDPARTFTYYKSGLLKTFTEGENWFYYEYDEAGNRTAEEAYTRDPDGEILHVRTDVFYDAHGRIAEVQQRDVTTDRGLLELIYAYDAVGNRRYVTARSAYDPNGVGIDINGITNPDFEHGDYGWVRGDGWTVVEGGEGTSTLQAQFNLTGTSTILNKQRVEVTPGEMITASVRVEQGASSKGEAGAAIIIQWYDAAGNALSVSQGNMVDDASGGNRYDSRITTTVPPSAAFMSIGARAFRNGGSDPLWIDDFTWGSMPPNASVEDESSWEWGTGFSWSNNYNGTAQFSYTGEGRIISTARVAVRSGSRVNARVNVQQGASSLGEAWGAVVVQFYDASGNMISESMGNRVDDGSGGAWHWSSLSVRVPPGAVTMAIGGAAGRTGGNDPLWLDDFSWNYQRDGELDPDYQYVDPNPDDAYNGNEPAKAYWYDYDAENRVKVANGKLEGGEIVLGSADISYALDYDEAGRATRRRFLQGHTQVEEITDYDDRGQRERVYQARAIGSTDVVLKEQYTYDGVGHVTQRREYFDQGETRNGIDIAGWLKHAETFSYDADGRVLRQDIKGRILGWTAYAPTDNGEYERTQLATLRDLAAVDYSRYGYDEAGRLGGYSYYYWQHEEGSGAQSGDPKNYTHSYVYQYEAREGYLEARVYGHSNNTNFRASTSYSEYDAWGRRVAVREQTPLPSNVGQVDDRIRYFSYDSQGNILRRREGSLVDNKFEQDPWQKLQTQLYAYVGGTQVASGKFTGEVDVVGRLTAYQSNGSAGSQRTTVLAGETLRSIAQRVYGNANLWYVLAEANAIVDDSGLTAGTTLLVPEVKVTANDANTFKPFNPAEAIGNTAPSMPYIEPPPKEHCNAIAMVLMVVVAVVVTVYTAGAAASLFAGASGVGGASTWAVGMSALTGGGAITGAAAGTVLATSAAIGGAAVGGFMGSVASQAVGSAMGATSFNLRNAFAAGGAAALTAGIGSTGALDKVAEALGGSRFASGAATAVSNNLANQAAQRAMGAETSFSWRSIATSAVSAGLTASIMPVVSDKFGWDPSTVGGQRATDLAYGLVGGVVSRHVGQAFGMGAGADYRQIAVDAFGNMLGNAMARKHSLLAMGNVPTMDSPQESAPASAVGGIFLGDGLAYAEEDAVQRQHLIAEAERASGESARQRALEEARLAEGREAAFGFPGGEVRSDQDRLPDIWLSKGGKPGPIVDNAPVLVEALHDNSAREWITGPDGRPQRVMTPELLSRYREDQITYYSERFSIGVWNAVAEPVRMVTDLGKAAYSVVMTEATGQFHEVQMSSAMGRAAEAGGTTGELLQELNPVYGLLVAQYEIRNAVARDDWGSVTEMGGGMLAGIVMSRRGGGMRTFGAVVDVAEETAALRRIANLNATPEAKALHSQINMRAAQATEPTSRIRAVGDPSRPGGYIKNDVDLHGNLSPRLNRAPGNTNTLADNHVQSHHPIQNQWAEVNVAGYNRDIAPGVLLESSSGYSHAKISAAQRAYRAQMRSQGMDPFATTIRQEFQMSYRQMIDAGVPLKVAQRAMKDSYLYFDSLGAF